MLSAVARHKLLQGLRLPGDVLCEPGAQAAGDRFPGERGGTVLL